VSGPIYTTYLANFTETTDTAAATHNQRLLQNKTVLISMHSDCKSFHIVNKTVF